MSDTLKDKRILLVDDDQDILTSMQAAFEPTGAVVETANNGNKAVEMNEKSEPDLIVLDMMLPGRSGFLVLEKLQQEKFEFLRTKEVYKRAMDIAYTKWSWSRRPL